VEINSTKIPLRTKGVRRPAGNRADFVIGDDPGDLLRGRPVEAGPFSNRVEI
jgi:hypothetical protein